MLRAVFAVAVVTGFLVAAAAGCTPIERDAACVEADACDAATDDPTDGFAADDEQFGDTGTCWLSEGSAEPCILACDRFKAEQIALGQAAGNDALVVACGGSVE